MANFCILATKVLTTGKSYPINWKQLKTIRENGLDKKKKRNELWRIKTELVYFFKRNNKVTSLYTDSGPSIDITLPLFKILDKNSISWLDLFTFEVCSFINHEFAGNRFYGFGDCPALPIRYNDEIRSKRCTFGTQNMGIIVVKTIMINRETRSKSCTGVTLT